jgi:hypothetical protein
MTQLITVTVPVTWAMRCIVALYTRYPSRVYNATEDNRVATL